MSTKYRFGEQSDVYFTKSTVAAWQDIFTRDICRNVLLDSIRFCQRNQNSKGHHTQSVH
jgi:putative transposase